MNFHWELSEKGLSEYRDCPICAEILKDHPSLDIKNVLKQKKGKKDWYHTTRGGRILHKWTIKNRKQETG